MKTVRFSKVVEKCGKPEVYLLMTETDPDFQKALHAEKVMSLSDDSHGAGTEYGMVGYDKKRKGQLLVFPKSLKFFVETKVVGIKYELFAEEEGHEPSSKKKTETKATPKKAKAATTKPPEKLSRKPAKPAPAKVIAFPKPEEEDDDDSVDELKSYARQAMRALEKNNSVAAYNLLKRIAAD